MTYKASKTKKSYVQPLTTDLETIVVKTENQMLPKVLFSFTENRV